LPNLATWHRIEIQTQVISATILRAGNPF
jgi:hypothetical protein